MNCCTPPHMLLYKDGHMLGSDRQTDRQMSTSVNRLQEMAKAQTGITQREETINSLSLVSHLFGHLR